MKALLIQDQSVQFKLDTGSDVNCIPIGLIKRLNIPIDSSGSFTVTDYNSNAIKVYGEASIACIDPDRKSSHVASFLVVDNKCEPLLGLESCISFNLIQRLNAVNALYNLPSDVETFVQENKDIFEGLGRFPGTCSIILKDGATPSLHYKKRVPLSLIDRLKAQLSSMTEQGIISAVDYPTDWVNNMQIVEKPDGSLRICLDPKPLNMCIKREHFLIPTAEDIVSQLSGKHIFTVLDLSNGFWQMELDRKSSDLTTFMTPFGRFRWNRVPFGLNSAPEMFQKKMIQIFGDIPGVKIYFDDIAISGSDLVEHDCTLAATG
ncbi:uncharacterized protein K02A2.6-like [Temnothorax curvispinosus]|uniref:Uncharacterized protein K02A2.6-like n=1 Tax=Temnothorax curvispinosus TaxID=300111 RepID=A0A6J1R9U6_9HYME|nr:uncharacterized protein K02A2.6-like [Temnothorax curvispinosus]